MSLSPWDRTSLREAIAKQVPEATRTAKPIGAASDPDPAGAPESEKDEISAF
jgi:hypothetical protein